MRNVILAIFYAYFHFMEFMVSAALEVVMIPNAVMAFTRTPPTMLNQSSVDKTPAAVAAAAAAAAANADLGLDDSVFFKDSLQKYGGYELTTHEKCIYGNTDTCSGIWWYIALAAEDSDNKKEDHVDDDDDDYDYYADDEDNWDDEDISGNVCPSGKKHGFPVVVAIDFE
ncbi:hypothetical protein Sste5346_005538 [Sporothrix stenoceras]|uniref:Uncharacterized protein n=1 Tax=Sporothrix stenoceras TaxID=5173 RepID=A0ABR3Z3P1_9PEZI